MPKADAAVGSLVGLTQGFHGFATARIADVAGGLTFAISSSYAALAALLVVGLPLADRAVARERAPGTAVRRVAWGFPPFALLVVALTVLLVMVPIQQSL